MKNTFLLGILLIAGVVISCRRDGTIGNPFENATTLDCNNLRVRKVEMLESNGEKIFRIFIENTCKACDTILLPVYDQLYLIEKLTNDTIGYSDCACLRAPSNKATRKYDLRRTTDQMPDLTKIMFSMRFTCPDVKYQP